MNKRAVWIVYAMGVCALVAAHVWGADAAAPAAPADANPARLSISTERVVVFKDGYGLFIKSATAKADAEGVVFTDSVPDGAVLGCFWATADGKSAIGMRAEFEERKEERVKETACLSVVEILRANKGKKATLTLNNEKAAPVAGTITDVLEIQPEKENPRKHRITVPTPTAIYRANVDLNTIQENEEYPRETVRELTPTGGTLAVIDETPQGRMVLPVADIRSVAGAELVTKMQRREEVTIKSKRLSFDLGKESAGQPAKLHILYFAEGVRWIPTYRVSGALEENAEIALQGEIVNEAEDISNAALDLVVGVPNFRFKSTVSPLSLEANLRLALNTAAPTMAGNDFSNAIYSQNPSSITTRRAPEAAGGGLNLAPELAAGGAQDLFVYGTKSFSLKREARATVPLWQSTSTLRHVYTLDLKDTPFDMSRRQNFDAQESPLTLAKSKVWHQYELTNSGTAPWTTGAALILKNNLPLGQELMTYTPPGAKTLLPVTVAVDMTGDLQEKELGRTVNALRLDGYEYSLIQKRATISIDNFRKEKSTTRVTFTVTGKADKATEGGKIEINDRRANVNVGDISRANNESTVSWDLVVEPGTCKVLTVDYTYYSR